MKSYKLITVLFAVTLFISGCADKNGVDEYNKPAEYWYENIVDAITAYQLDKADDFYVSLQSEHSRSPLLESATLILAQAHENSKENLLAEFYYDEYIKRYATQQNLEYYKFKKIDASFKHIKSANRNQKLIHETIEDAKAFVQMYPNSIYNPMVKTVQARLEMTRFLINENIASLYERLDKPKAAKIYRKKNEDSWIISSDLTLPEKTYIEMIFE